MENFIENNLCAKIQIKEAEKIGETVCKSAWDSMIKKEIVMKNKIKLRTLQERIFINNKREIQKRIRDIAEYEKRKQKQVRLGYQKLAIDEREKKSVKLPKQQTDVKCLACFVEKQHHNDIQIIVVPSDPLQTVDVYIFESMIFNTYYENGQVYQTLHRNSQMTSF